MVFGLGFDTATEVALLATTALLANGLDRGKHLGPFGVNGFEG